MAIVFAVSGSRAPTGATVDSAEKPASATRAGSASTATACVACGKRHRTLTSEQCADRRMSEKVLQARVVYRARKHGWTVAHAGRGQVGAEGHFVTPMSKGWPDLTCAKAGHEIVFMECKRQLGAIEPEQWDWLLLLNNCGAKAVIVRPSDLREGKIETMFREGSPL